MPYWWEYETDLVGDKSDEPRLPAAQLDTLFAGNGSALYQPARRRAWQLLLSPSSRRQRRMGGHR